eukprot:CAMPEP_0203759656 /NCGR_PEP_ID=MMETSP0098-20131031/12759_1 /ASSEMBLY_ACC=CAM_ASM_000208 /TAXON_ID=96639 /ORGANISM=" , Strain NY0313808BC1" /LENGTH=252 /DNA_ID=CAMNT_0050652761 /DNA_START=2524 /DNA_END=3282 /DNA_ORIENTATION=-
MENHFHAPASQVAEPAREGFEREYTNFITGLNTYGSKTLQQNATKTLNRIMSNSMKPITFKRRLTDDVELLDDTIFREMLEEFRVPDQQNQWYGVPSNKKMRLATYPSSFKLEQPPSLKVEPQMAVAKPTIKQEVAEPFTGPLTTGSWLFSEDRLLMHIIYGYVAYDLKTIAEVAWKCGIRRTRRAVDKKVKRILRFEKWRNRKINETKLTLKILMREREVLDLPESDMQTLQAVRVEFENRAIHSHMLYEE